MKRLILILGLFTGCASTGTFYQQRNPQTIYYPDAVIMDDIFTMADSTKVIKVFTNDGTGDVLLIPIRMVLPKQREKEL